MRKKALRLVNVELIYRWHVVFVHVHPHSLSDSTVFVHFDESRTMPWNAETMTIRLHRSCYSIHFNAAKYSVRLYNVLGSTTNDNLTTQVLLQPYLQRSKVLSSSVQHLEKHKQ